MKALAIYCHPEPRSFTRAMLDVAMHTVKDAGHGFDCIDLYADGFDPVAGRHDFEAPSDPDYFHYQTEQRLAHEGGTFAPVLRDYQRRVAEADLLVPIFPLWWGGPPAMLKGWFDRVMAYGFAYVDGARFESGLFAGKRALVAVTTGGTQARFSDDGTYGSIDKVLWPLLHCQLRYLGYAVAEPFVAYAAPRVSQEERGDLLDSWARRVVAMLESDATP